MAYEAKTWECGEYITNDKLNHMEDGIAQASAQVANLVATVKPNTVKTLWTGRLNTVNMSATLSESVSNFDFLDFYTDNGEAHRVPVSRGNIEIKSNNVSDDASLTFFHLGETRYSFSDTTVTMTQATSYINDNVSVRVEADTVYGTIVTRIDGVKVGSSNSAELVDVRVGADNVTYASAGEAVRTQFTNLKSELPQTITITGTTSANGEIAIAETVASQNVLSARYTSGSGFALYRDDGYVVCFDGNMQPKANTSVSIEVTYMQE